MLPRFLPPRGVLILEPLPSYADVRPYVSVQVAPHAYLLCACGWGEPLQVGVTDDGARVFLCDGCEGILDTRRVS